MCARSAKPVAQLSRAGIRVSARIDQQWLSVCDNFNRECVGMRVSAIIGSMWATIEEQIVCTFVPTIAHYVVTAISKSLRLRGGFLRFQIIKDGRGLRAE